MLSGGIRQWKTAANRNQIFEHGSDGGGREGGVRALGSIHVASLQGGRTFDQTHGHLAQANPSHSLLLMAEWWRVRS